MKKNPITACDFYKIGHHPMYPFGTIMLNSNWTPRKSRIKGITSVVVIGIQSFVMDDLIENWNVNFFSQPLEKVLAKYKRIVNNTIGKVSTTHIDKLHKLGYLPLKIKALPEGSLCPIGVPAMTITNTVDHAFWLVNYLETILSCSLWQGMTSATIARQFRILLNEKALLTTGSTEGVQWQGHDFSMRGMSSYESACYSGFGHLLSFTGTDSIPAIEYAEQFYGADVEKELVGSSVPATEHSVMCMGEKESEIKTFKRLFSLFPEGILSVVSDTWDLWKVCTEYLPALKEDILTRNGKLVIRPDSGDPVDILCGTFQIGNVKLFEDEDEYGTIDEAIQAEKDWTSLDEIGGTHVYQFKGKLYEVSFTQGDCIEATNDHTIFEIDSSYKEYEAPTDAVSKGVVELLWDTFGGTVNKLGFKLLDPHIGAIYGDSITLERAEAICDRLMAKGFASTNVVLGIGSYTYQYNTRDTFGFAMKATYGEVEMVAEEDMSSQGGPSIGETYVDKREIFKDPITDDGTKKSKKGLLQVKKGADGVYYVKDQATPEEEEDSELQTVFLDGKLMKFQTLSEIRERLNSVTEPKRVNI